MSTPAPKVRINEMRSPIGPENEWEAILPLTSMESWLATHQQRACIGWITLDTILKEEQKVGDEAFIKGAGLQDPAASIVAFVGKEELENV